MSGRNYTKEQIAAQSAAIFDLKLSGRTIRDIAAETNLSVGTVHRRLTNHMKNMVDPKAETLRRVYDARYERVIARLEPLATQGDPAANKAQMQALEHLRRLHGLDAPSQSEITTHATTDTDRELAGLIEQINARNNDIKEEI